MADKLIEGLSRGARRARAFLLTSTSPRSTKAIAEYTKLPYSTTARVLKELESKGLVIRVNESAHRGNPNMWIALEAVEEKEVPTHKLAQVYWPPLLGYVDILTAYRDGQANYDALNNTLKSIVSSSLATLVSCGMDPDQEDAIVSLAKAKSDLQDLSGTLRGLINLVDSLVSTEALWDVRSLRRVMVNTEVTQSYYANLRKDHAKEWSDESVFSMTVATMENNDPVGMYWVEAVFHLNWNEPLTLNEIHGILYPLEKSRILTFLKRPVTEGNHRFRELISSSGVVRYKMVDTSMTMMARQLLPVMYVSGMVSAVTGVPARNPEEI